MLKVRVEREECAGIGNCVVLAPQVFRLDAENRAVVSGDVAAEEQTLWDAAQSCPRNAIILEDDQGRQVYP